jgi:hypothetical protein
MNAASELGPHTQTDRGPQVLHRCAQAVSRSAARCASQVLDRGAQANARGATHVLDRGVQAVVRGAARCALHVNGRGARADACGRSFAVLSTQVSKIWFAPAARSAKTDACGRSRGVVDEGFSSWLAPRLTCGSMLEVSRDAFAAGKKHLVSCVAE